MAANAFCKVLLISIKLKFVVRIPVDESIGGCEVVFLLKLAYHLRNVMPVVRFFHNVGEKSV